MKLSDKDKKQINAINKTEKQVLCEQSIFVNGIPKLDIQKPATTKYGITMLNAEEKNKLADYYIKEKENKKIVKFVPASGAASRMFKVLVAYTNDETLTEKEIKSINIFFEQLDKFPFYYLLEINKNDLKSEEDKKEFLKKHLLYEGLSYLLLPKGLIHFHTYDNELRTPVVEHLKEADEYASNTINGQKNVDIHFTVQETHKKMFKSEIIKYNEDNKNHTAINYSFSNQTESTNTLAVDMNNEPFRLDDGSILFRPGGHGALLENLNNIDADVIFIKNIDNVTVDSNKKDTYLYKKVLAGLLLKTKKIMESYIMAIEDDCSENKIQEIKEFFIDKINIDFGAEFDKKSIDEKKIILLKQLNAPIRVAGMVKNEGEPGGGPFFVKDSNNQVSLQILEQAQLDMNDPKVSEMVKSSTHFNPVDIVCSTRTPKGEKINLPDYVDKNTFFIAEKSLNGKKLKALELPGLWNGSMAHWSTIYVEVPISTFSPVKEINDLLKPQHQES